MTSITRFGRTGRPILTVLLASVPFAIHFAPALADESPEDESSSTAFVAPEITGPVDVPSDEDPLDDPRLSDQGPLTEASDKIQMLVADSGMSGFGGTRIDHKMDALTLYWNGSVPEVISGLVEQLALTGTDIQIEEVAYSLSELDAEAQRIAKLGADGIGVLVTSIGPLDDMSGLRVTVAPGERAQAVASLDSSIPLHVSEMSPVGEADTRWDHTSPFWGGAAIDHLNNPILRTYDYCTTGFAARRESNGNEVMITARHCGRDLDWRSPLSDQLVGHSGATGDIGTDSVMLSGANYYPRIFVGAWNDATPPTRTISGAANPADESYVFVSGSWSGAAVVRVTMVNQYVNVDGDTRGPAFWTVDEEHDGSVGQGDSGGPTAGGGTTPTVARGIITALDRDHEVACQGKTFSGRICSWRALSINIVAILNAHNLNIQHV